MELMSASSRGDRFRSDARRYAQLLWLWQQLLGDQSLWCNMVEPSSKTLEMFDKLEEHFFKGEIYDTDKSIMLCFVCFFGWEVQNGTVDK